MTPHDKSDKSGPAPAVAPGGATAPSPAPDEALPWGALFAMMVGFFMLMLDTTIVVVAMPNLSEELHTDVTATVWVTSAYLLTYAVPLLLAGRLGDRYGPKQIYLVGMAVFTAASLLCGLSPTIGALIASRALQGVGAALMAPQSMAAVGRLFPKERRGRAMSYWGAVSGIAILVGPVTGGLLIDSFGWRSIFFINIPIGIAGLVVAHRLVPAMAGRAHRFDIVGVVLSGLALLALVYALETASSYHWGTITDDLSIVGLHTGIGVTVFEVLGVGVALALAFVLWEARAANEEPLLPLGIFANRTFAVSAAAIVLSGFSISAATFPGTLYFQVGRGLSPTEAALMMMPSALVSVPLAPQVGKLVDRYGPKWPAVAGLATFSVALFLRQALMTPDMPLVALLAQALLMGAGSALMMSPLAVSAMQSLPPRYIGAGSGVFNTARQIGSTLGAAVVATLLTSQLRDEMAAQAAHLSPEQRQTVSGVDLEHITSGADGTGAAALHFLRAVMSYATADVTLWPAVTLGVGALLVLVGHRPRRPRQEPTEPEAPAAAPPAEVPAAR